MPKTLLLIRHAEAEEPSLAQKDFDRELTSSGTMRASRIGRELAAKGEKPDAFFSSSAKRAVGTAELVGEQLGLVGQHIQYVDELYNASPRTLLDFFTHLADRFEYAVVVSHNPGITYLTEYLTGAEIGTMSMGSAAKIVFPFAQWALISQRSGELAWYSDFTG
ncbi:MAG: histidine phosphatase family protein [Bernardetiaceae bacterium]|jgi:phosphohistidine phosphatase|nr:histidine phosphatase family protein [Bernardetiaceae bacterium]